MGIILMLILVVPFAFVQQITDVLDILCLDHFYFAGVWRIILFSRIPHTHTSLFSPAPALAHQELSRTAPCCIGSRGNPAEVLLSTSEGMSLETQFYPILPC